MKLHDCGKSFQDVAQIMGIGRTQIQPIYYIYIHTHVLIKLINFNLILIIVDCQVLAWGYSVDM
jgi:hypothetical protein